jgi:hypothetical protein
VPLTLPRADRHGLLQMPATRRTPSRPHAGAHPSDKCDQGQHESRPTVTSTGTVPISRGMSQPYYDQLTDLSPCPCLGGVGLRGCMRRKHHRPEWRCNVGLRGYVLVCTCVHVYIHGDLEQCQDGSMRLRLQNGTCARPHEPRVNKRGLATGCTNDETINRLYGKILK